MELCSPRIDVSLGCLPISTSSRSIARREGSIRSYNRWTSMQSRGLHKMASSYQPNAAEWEGKARATLHSGTHWDRFYRHNGSGFFKDRHWMDSAFPCLRAAAHVPMTMLEIGCGTGAALLVLLQRLPLLRAVGFDVSKAAVDCIRTSACEELGGGLAARRRLSAFQHSALPPAAVAASALSLIGAAEAKRREARLSCDLGSAADGDNTAAGVSHAYALPAAADALLQPWIGHIARASLPHLSTLDGKGSGFEAECGRAAVRWCAACPADNPCAAAAATAGPALFDFALLMFTLSAMSHELHGFVLREAALAVKPGTGRVLLRDYCIGDAAADRLSGIGPQLFVRGDGTLAAFIDPGVLVAQAAAAGLVVDEMSVVTRAIENRAGGETFNRKWLNVVLRRVGDPADESRLLLQYARRCSDAYSAREKLPAAEATRTVLTAMQRLLS